MAFSTENLAILAMSMCICLIIQEADAAIFSNPIKAMFKDNNKKEEKVYDLESVIQSMKNAKIYNCKDSINESQSKVAVRYFTPRLYNSVVERYRIHSLYLKKIIKMDLEPHDKWCDRVQLKCMENIRMNGFVYEKYIAGNYYAVIKQIYNEVKNKAKDNIVREFIETDGSNNNSSSVIELYEYSYLVGKKINFEIAENLRDKQYTENEVFTKKFRDNLLKFKAFNPNLSENELYDQVADVESFCIDICVAELERFKYNNSSLTSTNRYFVDNLEGAPGSVVQFTLEKKESIGRNMMEETLKMWCRLNWV